MCKKHFFSLVFVLYTSLLHLSPSTIGPGVFILNLACRNPAMRKSTLERVSAVFPTILSKKIEEEINEILLCSRGENETQSAAHILQFLNQGAKSLQGALCSSRTGTSSSPHIDIAELLKDLKVE